MQIQVRGDGSEIVKYDNPQFPFYIKEGLLSRYHNHAAIEHWHEDIELIYVTEGEMQYNVNGDVMNLKAGEGLFINARQIHRGYSEDYRECGFFCLLFHPVIFSGVPFIDNRFTQPIIRNNACPYHKLHEDGGWEGGVLALIRQIGEMSGEKAPELRYLSAACTIWQYIYENLPLQKEAVQDRFLETLKKMIRFIQNHYTEKITLSDIAGAGFVSKTGCGEIFKHYVGRTPVEYLIDYRLSAAAELLGTTDMTVLEISLATGFSGSSYFCEMFRRRFGKSPMEFKAAVAK